MRLARRLAAVCAFFLGVLPAGQAAPLDILRQFNVVVSGDAAFSTDVGGRTAIGGNLVGGAQFHTRPDAADASAFRGLTVYGNSTSRNWISINNGGGVTIAGTAAGGFNLNGGGGRSINGVGTPAPGPLPNFTTSFTDELVSFSRSLAGLAPNSQFLPGADANNVPIRASAGTGLAVFAVQAGDLERLNSFSLDLNGREGAIINVFGNYDGKENFLNAKAVARDVIWNFFDATSIGLNRQWGGTVLAPNAMVGNSAEVFGTLFASGLNANAAWWSAPFENAVPVFAMAQSPSGTVDVPEPAAIALFGVGLLGLVSLRRRRLG